jgi:prolyl oligopeptidase
MNAKQNILAAGVSLLVVSSCRQASLPKVSYPATQKGDVVEDYFGTKVPDPYRWMEDLDSKPVADWIAAENKVTFDYLAKLPMREHFKRRITELWDYPKVSIPVREGGRYFYSKNSGLQRQAPIYVRSSLTAPATRPFRRRRRLAHAACARPRLRQGSAGRSSLDALLRYLLDQ